jgi:hypothetical protein
MWTRSLRLRQHCNHRVARACVLKRRLHFFLRTATIWTARSSVGLSYVVSPSYSGTLVHYLSKVRLNILIGSLKGSGISSGEDLNPPNRVFVLADSSCQDRALLVLGSNTAKQAALTTSLGPTSTHFRPPLTHTSHHRPALVDLSRFVSVSGVSHSRFRRCSMCVPAVSGVSLVGVSLLSADVAVTVVRPEVIYQPVFISRGRTRAH